MGDARRREREAFYKNETLRKMAELQGGAAVVEYLREEERQARRRKREEQRLAGVVLVAVGLGLGVFLELVEPGKGVYGLGAIPLAVGVALLVYQYGLAPRTE
jgi:di/tricarboxylate transporter